MRAFITGITGFAGQYLTQHLIAAGDQVAGSTFRDSWSDAIAPHVRTQVPLYEWNLAQPLPSELQRHVKQFAPHCIYHLAAISVPADCGTAQPSPLAAAVNVEGTRAVLQLAQSLDPLPRVLMVSSAHVYAPVSPEQPIVTEQSPVGPALAYGVTKLAAEELCRHAAAAGLNVVIARAFQHSGPQQLPKFMLPEWAQQFAASHDAPIQVVTLDSHFDLSDVRDVVRAYRLLLARPATTGVYNVGRGGAIRSGDVFDALVQLTGRQRQVIEQRPGRRQHPIPDISRLQRDTDWTPQIPLTQTIADTLAYFQQLSG